MGVNIGSLVPTRSVKLTDLEGRIIGIDGHNVSYQFLSRIRNRETGEPLRDRQGRVTSHLSGLFYRTSNLIEAGIKPLYVWDGTPPKFKERTISARRTIREAATRKWAVARERGEEAMVYAQAASRLTVDMVRESIQLLEYMGVPSVPAPSEGEAQLAVMAAEGEIWAAASQDWDSLLFNSPRLVRNLSITGRRKLPRKRVYVEITPEIVDLEMVLRILKITREQLIIIGILIGTDYNPGVKKIGPKTALRLVKKHRNLDQTLANVEWEAEVDADLIYNFFLDPPATRDYHIQWRQPNTDKLVKFMVEEHDFAGSRVEKVAQSLRQNLRLTREQSLESFFG